MKRRPAFRSRRAFADCDGRDSSLRLDHTEDAEEKAVSESGETVSAGALS